MSEKIVQLNEEVIKGQIKELVRGSVEETLNELLEKEAESLTQAARYERSEARQGYRSGHYDRNLTTTSGDVTLHMPRLKGVSFETAIIERYRRRESSVEEALIEMYLAGVSVRRVEDITEALWGSKVSPATISELNKKAYVHIEDWRNRPLQGGRYPYVYVRLLVSSFSQITISPRSINASINRLSNPYCPFSMNLFSCHSNIWQLVSEKVSKLFIKTSALASMPMLCREEMSSFAQCIRVFSVMLLGSRRFLLSAFLSSQPIDT